LHRSDIDVGFCQSPPDIFHRARSIFALDQKAALFLAQLESRGLGSLGKRATIFRDEVQSGSTWTVRESGCAKQVHPGSV
jgi:hypothetical protein